MSPVGPAPTTDQAGNVLTPEQKAALRDRIRNGRTPTEPTPETSRVTATSDTLADAVRKAIRQRLEVDPIPDIDTEPVTEARDELVGARAELNRLNRVPEPERGVEWQVRHQATQAVIDKLERERTQQQHMANEAQLANMLSGWHHP